MKIAFGVSLTLVAFYMATDIYVPSLPAIALYFSAPDDMAQQTITAFLGGALLSCMVLGPLADRFGKKKTILIGFALGIIASLGCCFVASIELLILGRFIQGASLVVGPVAGIALVQDHTSPKDAAKILGMVGFLIASIPTVAPMLGGFVSQYMGWRVNFGLILFIVIATFLASFKMLPNDTPQTTQKQPLFKSYGPILTNGRFLSLALITPIIYSGEWCYITILPFYCQKVLNISPSTFGTMISSIIIWYGFGSLSGTKVSKNWSDHGGTYIALLFVLGGALLFLCVAFVYPASLFLMWLSLSLYAFGFGMSFPLTVSRALGLFTNLRTTASSLRFLLITLFSFLGAYMAKVLDDDRLEPLAYYLLLTALLPLIIYTWGSFRESED